MHNLTVVGLAERGKSDREWKLHCRCTCGRYTDITPSQFNRGIVKSCGCLRKKSSYWDSDTDCKSPLYEVWKQMMYRCYNPKHKHYQRYGGRGIFVCDEWKELKSFEAWSNANGYQKGLTIDRINNNGGYCPENCRWVSMETQNKNRSSNIVIDYNGVSKTLADWAKELEINWITLHNRYVRGWTVERMLTEPVHKKTVSEGARR